MAQTKVFDIHTIWNGKCKVFQFNQSLSVGPKVYLSFDVDKTEDYFVMVTSSNEYVFALQQQWLKVAFFRKCISFFQISKENIPINFKLRVSSSGYYFLGIFFWRFEKPIALPEIKPPLKSPPMTAEVKSTMFIEFQR